MAQIDRAPWFVRATNVLTIALARAGEATLTRGRRFEIVTARELPKEEAALVLRDDVRGGNPFARYFGVTSDSSLEDFERAAVGHPLFVLEKK
jgi:hypothetical protein